MTSPVGQTGMVTVSRMRDGSLRVNCTDVDPLVAKDMLERALEAVEDTIEEPPSTTVVIGGVEYESGYYCEEE